MSSNIPSVAYTCEIQVRWKDTDMFGHINNANYITWLEGARLEWWNERKDQFSQSRVPGIMAHVEIDYIKPVELYDIVNISMWISRIGHKSQTTEYVIHGKDREQRYATARTVIVSYDFEKNTSVPIPEWYKEALRKFHSPQ